MFFHFFVNSDGSTEPTEPATRGLACAFVPRTVASVAAQIWGFPKVKVPNNGWFVIVVFCFFKG